MVRCGRSSSCGARNSRRTRGSAALPWVDDPSNDSPAFFRNRIRHDLLPALGARDLSLAEDLLALGRRAATWREGCRRVRGDAGADAHLRERVFVRGTAGAVDRNVAGGAVASCGRRSPSRIGLTLDRRGIARLAAFTIGGRVGSRIQLSGGWSAVRSRISATFTNVPVEMPASATIALSSRTVWGAWSFRPRPDAGSNERVVVPAAVRSPFSPSAAWEPGDANARARKGRCER